MPYRCASHELAEESFAIPIVAIVYDERKYPTFTLNSIVSKCRERGIAVAGVLQHVAPESSHACDALLEDVSTGHFTQIFEKRGADARGCRLNHFAMADASQRVQLALEKRPQLLVLNKFGIMEAQGKGLGSLFSVAAEMRIPTVVAIPSRNLGIWREFAGECSLEFADDAEKIWAWLLRHLAY